MAAKRAAKSKGLTYAVTNASRKRARQTITNFSYIFTAKPAGIEAHPATPPAVKIDRPNKAAPLRACGLYSR